MLIDLVFVDELQIGTCYEEIVGDLLDNRLGMVLCRHILERLQGPVPPGGEDAEHMSTEGCKLFVREYRFPYFFSRDPQITISNACRGFENVVLECGTHSPVVG